MEELCAEEKESWIPGCGTIGSSLSLSAHRHHPGLTGINEAGCMLPSAQAEMIK